MNPTLVLLAAGMSTRYGRLKQLEPVGPDGEALLDYAVFDAWKAGFGRVVLIIREELQDAFEAHVEARWPQGLEVGYHHQHIHDLPGLEGGLAASPDLGAAPADGQGPEDFRATLELAELIRERNKPWGTAHALLTARPHLPDPFVLLNADDFYGGPAFGQAVEFLHGSEVSSSAQNHLGDRPGTAPADVGEVPTFGLITYTLGDTLSDHGGVSRGICQVDPEGHLQGISEVLEIGEAAGGLTGRTLSRGAVSLSGQEPISTNFWIFTPAIFPALESGFGEFMKARLASGQAPQEFLIPTVVNQAITNREARVKAIPTLGHFLGITHPDDREWVVRRLAAMAEEGLYTDPLWG